MPQNRDKRLCRFDDAVGNLDGAERREHVERLLDHCRVGVRVGREQRCNVRQQLRVVDLVLNGAGACSELGLDHATEPNSFASDVDEFPNIADCRFADIVGVEAPMNVGEIFVKLIEL